MFDKHFGPASQVCGTCPPQYVPLSRFMLDHFVGLIIGFNGKYLFLIKVAFTIGSQTSLNFSFPNASASLTRCYVMSANHISKYVSTDTINPVMTVRKLTGGQVVLRTSLEPPAGRSIEIANCVLQVATGSEHCCFRKVVPTGAPEANLPAGCHIYLSCLTPCPSLPVPEGCPGVVLRLSLCL